MGNLETAIDEPLRPVQGDSRQSLRQQSMPGGPGGPHMPSGPHMPGGAQHRMPHGGGNRVLPPHPAGPQGQMPGPQGHRGPPPHHGQRPPPPTHLGPNLNMPPSRHNRNMSDGQYSIQGETQFGIPNPAYMPDRTSIHSGGSGGHQGPPSRESSLSRLQHPNIYRSQIPLPPIPSEEECPNPPLIGHGALQGVSIVTQNSVPILEPLTEHFRRSMRRKSGSKRYKNNLPPSGRPYPPKGHPPRMGMRSGARPMLDTRGGPHIPPLDGSPPDGWARPYPSPGVHQPDPNNMFAGDNKAFSSSPGDPEGRGHNPGLQGHPAGDLGPPPLRSHEGQRISRPPSYTSQLIDLSESVDGPIRIQDQQEVPGPGRMSRPESHLSLASSHMTGRESQLTEPGANQMSRTSSGKMHVQLIVIRCS